MRAKNVLLALASVALCLILSSCSIIEGDTESLLSPPKLTEEQIALHEAIKRSAGEDFHLVYPKTDESFSAFIFKDLDLDKSEEAMVFYNPQSDLTDTRLNVLKKKDNIWEPVYSISGEGKTVESVHFPHIYDGEECIAICWNVSSTKKYLSLYRFENEKLKALYGGDYEEMAIEDMDGDGREEILLFNEGKTSAGTVKMLSTVGSGVVSSYETEMSIAPTNFYAVTGGEIKAGKKGVFVDAKVSEGTWATEVITLNEGSLTRVIAPDVENERVYSPWEIPVIIPMETPPTRSTPTVCRDINGDGVMEIPLERERTLSGEFYENGGIDISFYVKAGEDFPTVWEGFVDESEGFAFTFPESWQNTVAVQKNHITGEYRFYLYGDRFFEPTDDTKEVLRIRINREGEYTDRFEEDYKALKTKGDKTFTALIPKVKADIPILTEEECKKLLILL